MTLCLSGRSLEHACVTEINPKRRAENILSDFFGSKDGLGECMCDTIAWTFDWVSISESLLRPISMRRPNEIKNLLLR